MTAPVRQTFRPRPERLSEFPTITRRETSTRQIGQVTYLLWRLDMFLKDREVPRAKRTEYLTPIRRAWARGNYEQTCQLFETVMKRFIQQQLDQIQAIFDER